MKHDQRLEQNPDSPWSTTVEPASNRTYKNDLGAIIDRGFNVGGSNFLTLLGLTLVPVLAIIPLVIVFFIGVYNYHEGFEVTTSSLGLISVGFLVILGALYLSVLSQASMVAAMLTAFREERRVKIGEALRLGKKYIRSYLLVTIVFSLLVMLGMIALIIPGLILLVLYYFAPYVVIDKDLGVIDSLKQAREVMRGNVGTFLVVILILTVVGSAATFIPLAPLLVAPFQASIFAYMYLAFAYPAPELD